MSRFLFFFYLGIILVAIGLFYAFAYGSNSTSNMTLDIRCDTMMYGGDDREWTLGYLREVVKYCSNGGGQ